MSSWRVWAEVPPESVSVLEDALMEAFALEPDPPSLSSFEIEEHVLWQVEIYFTVQPDIALIENVLLDAAHASGLTLSSIKAEKLEDRDWVSESQKLLHPVTAGRIFVHGSHDRRHRRAYGFNLQIEAGQAFGTGQHATTLGCLLMLERLARHHRPKRLCDLGCGSGVLAMAMARLWHSGVLASDIDPIATRVSAENATINRIPVHRAFSDKMGLSMVTAAGTKHPMIKTHAPYDLVTANILAGPLIDMAHDIAGIVAPGGRLILAGLLKRQEQAVFAAYRAHGLVREARSVIGDWPTLLLKRPDRSDNSRSHKL